MASNRLYYGDNFDALREVLKAARIELVHDRRQPAFWRHCAG